MLLEKLLEILDVISPNDKESAAELLSEQLRRLFPDASDRGYVKGGGSSLKPLSFAMTLGYLRFTGASISQMTKAQRYLRGTQSDGQRLFCPIGAVSKYLQDNPIPMHSGVYTFEEKVAGSSDDYSVRSINYVHWSLIDRLTLHLKNECDSKSMKETPGLGSPFGRRGMVVIANIESDHGGGTQSIVVIFNSVLTMSTEHREELGKFDAKESYDTLRNTITRPLAADVAKLNDSTLFVIQWDSGCDCLIIKKDEYSTAVIEREEETTILRIGQSEKIYTFRILNIPVETTHYERPIEVTATSDFKDAFMCEGRPNHAPSKCLFGRMKAADWVKSVQQSKTCLAVPFTSENMATELSEYRIVNEIDPRPVGMSALEFSEMKKRSDTAYTLSGITDLSRLLPIKLENRIVPVLHERLGLGNNLMDADRDIVRLLENDNNFLNVLREEQSVHQISLDANISALSTLIEEHSEAVKEFTKSLAAASKIESSKEYANLQSKILGGKTLNENDLRNRDKWEAVKLYCAETELGKFAAAKVSEYTLETKRLKSANIALKADVKRSTEALNMALSNRENRPVEHDYEAVLESLGATRQQHYTMTFAGSAITA